MPTIVDFPTIVQEALTAFGGVFDTEAARRHFAEFLTGLIVVSAVSLAQQPQTETGVSVMVQGERVFQGPEGPPPPPGCGRTGRAARRRCC